MNVTLFVSVKQSGFFTITMDLLAGRTWVPLIQLWTWHHFSLLWSKWVLQQQTLRKICLIFLLKRHFLQSAPKTYKAQKVDDQNLFFFSQLSLKASVKNTFMKTVISHLTKLILIKQTSLTILTTRAALRKTRLGQHWVNSCRSLTVKLTLWEREGNVSNVEELDQERSSGFNFNLADRDKCTCYSSINRTLSDRL